MNLSALEVASQYIAALGAGDTDRMNALRSPVYVFDFVYGDGLIQRETSYMDLATIMVELGVEL